MTDDLTCDVIRNLHINLFNVFGNFITGAIKCHFGIENRSIILTDSTGSRNAPPPIGWQHPEMHTPSGRGLSHGHQPLTADILMSDISDTKTWSPESVVENLRNKYRYGYGVTL